jgi:site-specific recombinase XerD
VANVRKLGDHYPDTLLQSINEAQVRDYFVHLRVERNYQPSTMNQAKCAIRCFYHDFLNVDPQWSVFRELIVKSRVTLPEIASREEIGSLLAAIDEPRFHTYLSLVYSCGLRLSEALAVQVRDIDAAAGRLFVREGKGGKPRYVPISAAMVEQLRAWWKQHRNPSLLFPATGRHWCTRKNAGARAEAAMKLAAMHAAEKPMAVSTVQNAIKYGVAKSGIRKRITIHTLRHCYATHLLEDGISLRHISAYLGHASLDQTVVYAHLTAAGEERTHQILGALHQRVIGKPGEGNNRAKD